MDYDAIRDEIKLRYVVTHQASSIDQIVRETARELAISSYSIQDITSFLSLDIISLNQNNGNVLSRIEMQFFNLSYHFVVAFEDALFDADGVLQICKTYDSFRIEESKEFLAELYDIEMTIREIYTVLARLQDVNLKNSRARILKEYQDHEQTLTRRAMNEFFFIEFSDYKYVDRKKDAKLEDLLAALRHVKKAEDIVQVVDDLSHSTLRFEERFNELAKVPEAIGRLEDFRNCIAHNRYISEGDLENLRKAKSIIDEVYAQFIAKLRNKEI